MQKAQYSKNNVLLYLASPYTHQDKKIMHERYLLVDKAAARLLKLGVMTYPPIAMNARWNQYEAFDHTWKAWETFDKNLLERCDGLLVLMIDGWERSIGIASEIEYARSLNMPIGYVTYEDLMDNNIDGVYNLADDALSRIKKEDTFIRQCFKLFL
jgi:hypothetical protein